MVQGVLTRELALRNPEFRLEFYGGRISGSIVSSSFKGKRDHQRQDMIWDALERVFGQDAVKKVGMLLAYTPQEWNIDGEADERGDVQMAVSVKRKKKG
jgi:acid stress-induced BolA-like protein IbaG/YrbA